MPSSEVMEWAQYSAIEPFGHVRENIHFGQILAMLANALSKRKGRTWTYQDFMIKDKEQVMEEKKRKQGTFVEWLLTVGKRANG